MTEWRCIFVSNHDEVGKAIMEWEQQRWRPKHIQYSGNEWVIELHS